MVLNTNINDNKSRNVLVGLTVPIILYTYVGMTNQNSNYFVQSVATKK